MGSCREIHLKYQQERQEKISELMITMMIVFKNNDNNNN